MGIWGRNEDWRKNKGKIRIKNKNRNGGRRDVLIEGKGEGLR